MEIIETKLGDISEIITGPFGSQLHQSDYVQCGIPSIMPQNIGNRTLEYANIACISEMDALRLARYTVKQNDIVYARRGDIEKHAFIRQCDEGALCGTGCMRIRVDPQKALPAYVSFFLNRPESKKWISQHAVGTNMPNLNTEILSSVPIQLPCMQIQQSIVRILECMDGTLSNNNQLCAELESMAKTLYDYWFVQFDFPDANGKPYRTSGGEMVWNEQLKREIPKGWNVYYVSDCCDIIDCLHSEKPKKEFENEDAFLLQLENLVDNGLVDITNKYYVSVEMYKLWTSRVEVRSGDLLVTNAGRAGAVYRMPEGVCAGMGRNMTAIRPNKVPPTLLYYFFTSRDMETQIKANTDTGAFFKSLNVRGIKQLRIVLPQTNESAIMHELEKRLSSIRHLVEQLSKESTELARLRDWLLPMLMNGQATVAPAEPVPKLQVLQPEKPACDPRFDRWLQTQGVAARGTVGKQTLHDIFDAMDDDDKQ